MGLKSLVFQLWVGTDGYIFVSSDKQMSRLQKYKKGTFPFDIITND